MKKYLLVLGMCIVPQLVQAQGIGVQPRYLIDMPIAYVLPRASFDVNMRLYRGDGLLSSVDVGMTDRFMIGVSFGGTNVLGEGDVDWNPYAGAEARYQLVSESVSWAAIAVGFNSQGQGAYIDSTKRFERKSPGFYAVMSKNYEVFDHLSFHVGANYSLETGDGDKDPNLFFGGELGFRAELALMGEYNFALNDNSDGSVGSGKGYLNMGLRYNIKNVVYFEVFVLDLFENFGKMQRGLRITYFEFF